MPNNKTNKQVSDSVSFEEHLKVVRYKGAKLITEMMQNDQHLEAYVHAQHSIEKILWDRIVSLFEGEKSMLMRRTIDNAKDRSQTKTYELIKWANYLGVIDKNEFSDLNDFNKKRNDIVHGHGQWYHSQDFTEALKKGIRFLAKNNFE
jgi:uncharacterized protein YutE (UPF0331/DUF86 family)